MKASESARDESGEAMVCTGCGTTKTVEHIRATHPTAFTCCPERKMIPVRLAITQAEARGREQERAAIVAWLSTRDFSIADLVGQEFAQAIQRGEHLPALIPGEPA